VSGCWVLLGIVIHNEKFTHSEDCSFNIIETTKAIITFSTLSNIIFTLGLYNLILLTFDNQNQEQKRKYLDSIIKGTTIGWFFLFICSILSAVQFFSSELMNGKLTTCSTEYGEQLFRTNIFGYLWFFLIICLYIVGHYLFSILKLLFNLIKKAKLCGFLNFFGEERRVNPVISRNEENHKGMQTDSIISIPIKTYDNHVKPFLCIICMENRVDVLIKPCYHICVCRDCYERFEKKDCPICKTGVKKIKNIYLSGIEDEIEVPETL